MVAADGDQSLAVGGQCGSSLLDLRDGLGNVERFNILSRVVRPEQPGRLAHVGGAEARAGAVADAAVEGDSDDRDVCARHALETGKTGEGRDTGIAGNQARVSRANRQTGVGHGFPNLERVVD